MQTPVAERDVLIRIGEAAAPPIEKAGDPAILDENIWQAVIPMGERGRFRRTVGFEPREQGGRALEAARSVGPRFGIFHIAEAGGDARFRQTQLFR